MKDVILLAVGFISGVLATTAFGAKVRAFIVSMLTKTAAKVGNKS